jgi:hypothetical protein
MASAARACVLAAASESAPLLPVALRGARRSPSFLYLSGGAYTFTQRTTVKGITFNLLEELVSREFGDDAWDDLLADSGLEGAYTSLGSYPDDELRRLVAAASPLLGMEPTEVVRWYGRNALPLLAEKYPQLFEPHESTRAFLLTLNDIIHPEVRKIYPGADVPIFDYDTSSADLPVMGYRSARKLCAFGEGLIEGAAKHYEEKATVTQTSCMNRGDEKCVFEIAFSN